MPTPLGYSQHTLVTFGGKLGTGTNIDGWQCGVRVAARLVSPGAAQTVLNDPGGYLAAITGPLATWFQRATVATSGSEFLGMSTLASLDWAKANNIRQDGRYLDQSVSHTYSYPTFTGGVSVTNLPPFLSLAVSFLTAKSRGPGHRGRIYLPFALPINTSGKVAALTTTQAGKAVKALLAVLTTPTDPNGAVGAMICSKIDSSINPVTSIAVGDVLDVQRRRKEQLPEAYTPITYP